VNDETLRKFNILCFWLERHKLLHAFYHALHETMFPGLTNNGGYNLIHAVQSSGPEDWHQAALIINKHSFKGEQCGFFCDVREEVRSLIEGR